MGTRRAQDGGKVSVVNEQVTVIKEQSRERKEHKQSQRCLYFGRAGFILERYKEKGGFGGNNYALAHIIMSGEGRKTAA